MANNNSANIYVEESFQYSYKREYELIMTYQRPLWPALLFVGLITNTLNIITFIKTSVKDSVSILLLTLSISDGIFLSLVSPTILRHGFFMLGSYKSRVWSDIRHLSFWPAFTFYDFSAYVSVFLGVTRCACVAMPLRFKLTFTRKRTVLSVVVLFGISVLLHIPTLSLFKLGWVKEPKLNTSYLTVLVTDPLEVILFKQGLNDTINKNIIQVASFIILVTCAALLRFKLLESSKIRSQSNRIPDSNEASSKSHSSSHTGSQKLSPKDTLVVQSVILVCSIYIIAQLPTLLYTAFVKFYPEFNRTGGLRNLVALCSDTSYTFYLSNASVNIFVYYNYNSKYRSEFRSLFNLKQN